MIVVPEKLTILGVLMRFLPCLTGAMLLVSCFVESAFEFDVVKPARATVPPPRCAFLGGTWCLIGYPGEFDVLSNGNQDLRAIQVKARYYGIDRGWDYMITQAGGCTRPYVPYDAPAPVLKRALAADGSKYIRIDWTLTDGDCTLEVEIPLSTDRDRVAVRDRVIRSAEVIWACDGRRCGEISLAKALSKETIIEDDSNFYEN